jgi:hypothetical protein
MNRLRDDVGGDPVSERGIELLRGTAPTPRNPELKRRVWTSLQRSQTRTGLAARTPVVRVLAFAMSTILVAGTAGAVITTRWIAPAIERAAAPSVMERPAAPRPAKPRALHKLADNSAVGAILEETPAPAPVVRPRAKAKSVAVVPRPAGTTSQERTQVLDALVALRRDHDPQRAGVLLERYLADHPRGALREEALILATEAADARGDHAQAQRFARSYQSEYPRGRFQQFAAQHRE